MIELEVRKEIAMPCRMDDYPSNLNQNDVDQAVFKVRNELEPLLCEACTLLEETGALSKSTKELQKWYQTHEECEKDRVRLEAAEKLTERERRLLGIDIKNLRAAAEVAKVKKGAVSRGRPGWGRR